MYAPKDGEPDYVEHLSVPDLSVGTYSLPAGSNDTQSPHTEDEIYVVISGRGKLWTPDATVDAIPGAVLFVPAREEHRFIDVVEDLTLLVVFGPAEYARSTPGKSEPGRFPDIGAQVLD